MAYHSALTSELDIADKLKFYEGEAGIVFAWDITHGTHELFRRADAIYAEPSWRAGYDKFLARADVSASSNFTQYLVAIREVIRTLHIPTYIVMGKHMLKALCPPVNVSVCLRTGYDARAGMWYVDALPDYIDNTDELLAYVCGRYETVLDFCCGYGNVAAYARRFVCSDINEHCVYHVAEKWLGYRG